jgi:sulfur carrier protein ThiS
MKVMFKAAAGFGYYYAPAKAYAEATACDIADRATVADLLESLSFPGKMAMNIFVNGQLAGRDTVLGENDKVHIMLTTAGG